MTSLSKNSIKIIIQLLWLLAFAGILEAALRFVIEQTELILLETYKLYFITLLLPGLLLTILLLKYYLHKKYLATFWTAILSSITIIIHSASVFEIITTLRAPKSYVPTLIAMIAAQFLYSLSLILKPAGTRPWLRIAGFYQVIIIIPVAFSIYLLLWAPSASLSSFVTRMQPLVSLVSALTPLLVIPNFMDEAPQFKKKEGGFDWQAVNVLIIILICGVTLKLSADAYWSVYWSKKNRRDTITFSKSLEPHLFIGSRGDTLYYGLRRPLNYDSTKKYPLLINLSLGAQPGKSISKSQDMGGAAVASLFLTKPYRVKYPAFIFVPSCPVGSSWGGIPGLKSSDDLLYEAIASLDRTEQGIDSKRHYVSGLSFAGYGTWNVIGTRPDLFAAAIPLCGGGNPKMAPKMVNVPIWAFHGEKDINVPVSYSRDMIQAITKAGGHPKYTEFAGQGHNIWDQTMKTEGIWEWLFAQQQNR
jgi:poly(3-hydroxybutyrate) depolymerase